MDKFLKTYDGLQALQGQEVLLPSAIKADYPLLLQALSKQPLEIDSPTEIVQFADDLKILLYKTRVLIDIEKGKKKKQQLQEKLAKLEDVSAKLDVLHRGEISELDMQISSQINDKVSAIILGLANAFRFVSRAVVNIVSQLFVLEDARDKRLTKKKETKQMWQEEFRRSTGKLPGPY